jgi:hypothetical protein
MSDWDGEICKQECKKIYNSSYLDGNNFEKSRFNLIAMYLNYYKSVKSVIEHITPKIKRIKTSVDDAPRAASWFQSATK